MEIQEPPALAKRFNITEDRSAHFLKTIDGESLISEPLEPIKHIISGLMSQGLHLLAGSPKIGKSWMILWMCLQIAKGEAVWDFEVQKGTTLYLCLEDSLQRIQNRLFMVTEEAPDNIHFATMSESIDNGLIEQIENFIEHYPDTVLIVIDTLQKVRSFDNDGNAYASDYRDINALKEIADRHKIAILLVHHLRKMNDNDPFNMVSGTTGLTGAVDGSFVLMKDKRSTNKAKLYATGRDIEYMELNLEFDKEQFIWKVISRDDGDDGKNPAVSRNPVVEAVMKLVSVRGNWSGTASELIEVLQEYATDLLMQPNSLSKALNQNREELQLGGIRYDYKRTSQKKLIYLTRINDGDDSNDGKSEVPPGE